MNRVVLLVVTTLLSVIAAVAYRRLRPPGAPVASAPDVAPQSPSPSTGGAPAAPAAVQNAAPSSDDAAPTASASDTASQADEPARRLQNAVESAYASTVAAFAASGQDADYEAHDARAKSDIERLEQQLSGNDSAISPELIAACRPILEALTGAQLHLMAFAINRKNRGLPDSAEAEAGIAAREAVKNEIEPLYERFKAVLA